VGSCLRKEGGNHEVVRDWNKERVAEDLKSSLMNVSLKEGRGGVGIKNSQLWRGG